MINNQTTTAASDYDSKNKSFYSQYQSNNPKIMPNMSNSKSQINNKNLYLRANKPFND